MTAIADLTLVTHFTLPTMNNLIPIGAGMLLATLYCALAQKLPVARTLLKIELTVALGITAHYATQAYF